MLYVDGSGSETATIRSHRVRYPTRRPGGHPSRYEATFEVDSKNGSHGVRQIPEHVHDSARVESRSIRKGTEDANESLESVETLQDAAIKPSHGELRIVYDGYDETFGD